MPACDVSVPGSAAAGEPPRGRDPEPARAAPSAGIAGKPGAQEEASGQRPERRLRVCVLTTSYPRWHEDPAGTAFGGLAAIVAVLMRLFQILAEALLAAVGLVMVWRLAPRPQ